MNTTVYVHSTLLTAAWIWKDGWDWKSGMKHRAAEQWACTACGSGQRCPDILACKNSCLSCVSHFITVEDFFFS